MNDRVATAWTVHRPPCAACVAELFDPFSRRYRYPFIACDHCGPAVAPAGPPCAQCAAERAAGGRHAHCYRCGPQLKLLRLDRRPFSLESYSMLDAADAAATLLQRGQLLALQGAEGWELLCDAACADALARLRAFAAPRTPQLLARDAAMAQARAAGEGGSAWFALPAQPVHHLLLARLRRPLARVAAAAVRVEALADAAEFVLAHGAAAAALAPRIPSPPHGAVAALDHHHRLLAACLAQPGTAALGAVFDRPYPDRGGRVWGGEVLRADGDRAERLATLKPVMVPDASPLGVAYGHLMAELGWPRFIMNYAALPLAAELAPYAACPGAGAVRSDCASLLLAVAVVLGRCRDAADPLEAVGVLAALADPAVMADGDPALDYPFAVPRLPASRLPDSRLPYVEPLAMWQALLGDCLLDTPPAVMAARFLRGFARVLVKLLDRLARGDAEEPAQHLPVVLAGAVFANRPLADAVRGGLAALGHAVRVAPASMET